MAEDNAIVPVEADDAPADIVEIRGWMRDESSPYFRGPKDAAGETPAMRRYRSWIEGRQSGDPRTHGSGKVALAEARENERMALIKSPDYWRNEQKQARVRALAEAEVGGLIEGASELAQQATGMGLVEEDAMRSVATALRVRDAFPADVAADIDAAMGGMHESMRFATVKEFGKGVPSPVPLTDEQVASFAKTDAGAILIPRWGSDAKRRLGVWIARVGRFCRDNSHPNYRAQLEDFIDERLRSGAERAGLIHALTE